MIAPFTFQQEPCVPLLVPQRVPQKLPADIVPDLVAECVIPGSVIGYDSPRVELVVLLPIHPYALAHQLCAAQVRQRLLAKARGHEHVSRHGSELAIWGLGCPLENDHASNHRHTEQ